MKNLTVSRLSEGQETGVGVGTQTKFLEVTTASGQTYWIEPAEDGGLRVTATPPQSTTLLIQPNSHASVTVQAGLLSDLPREDA